MRTTPLARAGAVVLLLSVLFTARADDAPRRPTKADKCPVCGMFVSRYPQWTAAVTFQDGTVAWFDGAKDMFRFLADPGKFAPGRKAADVKSATVTDYYAVKPVDAKEAWFVMGSDVLGPMGKELVPFKAKAEADDFRRDHKGKKALRFEDVNRAILDGLE